MDTTFPKYKNKLEQIHTNQFVQLSVFGILWYSIGNKFCIVRIDLKYKEIVDLKETHQTDYNGKVTPSCLG